MLPSNVSKVEKYFDVAEDKSKSVCVFPECKKSFVGFVPGNLKRHIIAVHKLSFGQPLKISSIPKPKAIKINMNAALLSRACIKMVTKDALPFRFMDAEGFSEIVKPIGSALGISVNSHNIQLKVKLAATKIRAVIVGELSNRMFSLKFYSATRNGRSILGVNAQFMSNDRIEVQTLGMIELKKRHTSEYIKTEVMTLLASYDCRIQQVFSCTVDKGANMVKCVSLLENAQDEELLEDGVDNTGEEIVSRLDGFIVQGTLRCVRCASHTLQLAVNDVLKQHEEYIKAVRLIIKSVRSVQMKQLFVFSKINIPPLDVPTRWNSTFRMLKSIFDNKVFYQTLEDGHLVCEELWVFLQNFVAAFECVFYCTKRLQEEQLTIGDFICSWMELKMKLSNINNDLSLQLLQKMEMRLKTLLSNDLVKAALYVDQRFNFAGYSSMYLSTEDKKEAEEYLLKLYTFIHELRPNMENISQGVQSPRCESQMSPLEQFYDSELQNSSHATNMPRPEVRSVQQQICELKNCPRLALSTDMMQTWRARKFEKPELYELATTLLAVSSSQVSVERAFSALALVLTNLRTCLKSDTLENILLIKLNYCLMDKINFEDD